MRKSLHFVRTERVNFGRNIIEHGTRVANLNSFEGRIKRLPPLGFLERSWLHYSDPRSSDQDPHSKYIPSKSCVGRVSPNIESMH